MRSLQGILLAALATIVSSQAPNTTPVPILKQINKQNDDGSYSYGYEAADGSFKIETKYPNGDVAGKYGYVDESGKTREISYGASSKRGFEPQGEGIVVAPPSLVEPSNALTNGEEDDGQYREDPSIYEDPKYNSKQPLNFRKSKQPIFTQFHSPSNPQPAEQYPQFPTQTAAPTQQYQQLAQPQYQPQYQQPSFRNGFQLSNFPNIGPGRPQSQIYHQQPQFSYSGYTPQGYQHQQYQPNQFQPEIQHYEQPQSYQPQSYQPQTYQQQQFNPFAGHPAQNFDPNTGSYTINFTG